MGLRPTAVPQILAPDFIASNLTEYNGTFTPDGREFYYTSQMPGTSAITYTFLQNDNTWAIPKVASFASSFSEYDPLFSPDGKRLYFSSERPVLPEDEGGQSNIWYVERSAEGWSDPVNIPLTDKGDYYSSITSDGVIYFNVWDDGDIYKAIERDTGWHVERLPDEINGGKYDVGDPFISADEDYLIYRGYKQRGRAGELFISFKENGQWSTPQILDEPINSNRHEMCPYVTTDGKMFVFASARLQEEFLPQPNETLQKQQEKYASWDNGQLNIYYMSTDFIEKLRKED